MCVFAILYTNNYFAQGKVFASESDLASLYPSAQDEKQCAVQEVAFQYYIRGTEIQYEGSRMNRWIAPEQITKQSSAYLVCSGFTAAVYNQAFGILRKMIYLKNLKLVMF